MDKTPNSYGFFLNRHNPESDSLARLALENFRDRSGLSAETLERARVRIFSGNSDKLKEHLGFASLGGQSILKIAKLVEIPSFQADGSVTEYHFKLCPPIGRNRYLCAKGEPGRPYILPEVWAVRDKPHKPLWITEGAKKVLKLIQHERAALGLQGVWNFREGAQGEETFLFDDLERFTWKGRTVYLGFDSDLWTNPQVRFALFELALKLMSRDAVIRLSKWTGEKGIDDYLAKQKDAGESLCLLENKASPLKKFISLDHRGEILRALKLAHDAFDALSWESLIRSISKKLNVRPSTLLAELREPNTTSITDTGVVIANPSYEINRTFMSLGFKETVIIDDIPSDRNVYIIATDGGFTICHRASFQSGEDKIVFNERDRILINLSDKWDKSRLTAFVKEPAPPEHVYQDIKAVLKGYIEFQNEAHYGLVTAWIVATYFHRCFNAFPFLSFFGKKQSGKSRALDLLERLCSNAIKIKGISVPSLADSVDAVCSTFLMDQAEILSDKKNVELLGILADSYTVGGGRRRIVHITNKSRRVVEFETFCPKAYASTKEIDPDLKDRCIEITMIRAEKEYPYPEAFLPVWLELRDKLYRLLLTRWRDAREIYQTAGQGIKQRVRELWRPLDTILILEKVPEDERVGIREAFLESMLETQAGLTDLEVTLFNAITALLGQSEKGTFTVSDIVDKIGIPETEGFKPKSKAKWVGRTLKKLSLFTKKGPRVNNKHSYLFTLEHVTNIFNRYQNNGIDGTTAEESSINDLDTAVQETESACNSIDGSGQTEDMPPDADTADNCQEPKTNGRPESLDNQQDCHYADTVIQLAEDEKEIFEERASIMEFDGGLTREEAEGEAMRDANPYMEK